MLAWAVFTFLQPFICGQFLPTEALLAGYFWVTIQEGLEDKVHRQMGYGL